MSNDSKTSAIENGLTSSSAISLSNDSDAGWCMQYGKDKVIVMPENELEKASKIELREPREDEMEHGLVLPDGEINWNCPCLGGMASGPCGFQFREAFSCFHMSKSETKGEECIDRFNLLQECMASYPNLYPGDKQESSFDTVESSEKD